MARASSRGSGDAFEQGGLGGGFAQARPRARGAAGSGGMRLVADPGGARADGEVLSRSPEVVHLQSGHGPDDTALVRAGASSVIGVDYSQVAASAAQHRADE